MIEEIICPVKGHLIEDIEFAPSCEYKVTWYFCSANCKNTFITDPKRFVHPNQISEKSDRFTDKRKEKVRISIEEISCASSAVAIEKEISKLPGVKNVVVNGVIEMAYVEFDRTETSLSQIIAAIKKSGYKAGLCYRVD